MNREASIYKTTIRTRFTLYTIFFTTIIIIIVVTYITNLYSSKMLEDMKEISNLHLELVTEELDNAIDGMFQMFQKIQDNDELQIVLERPISAEYSDETKKHDVSEILREYAYADISIISVFISDVNRQIQDPFYQIEPYSSIVSGYKPLTEYLEDKEPTITSIGRFPLKFESEKEGINTITFIDELLSKDDFSSLGTLLITSKVDFTLEAFTESCNDNFDFVYITNENNQLIYKTGLHESIDSTTLLLKISESISDDVISGIVDSEGSTYYISKKNLDIYSDWKIIGVKEYTELQSNYKEVLDVLILFGILSVPVLLLFSYLYARRITGPIVKLNAAMHEFSEGEWPDKVKAETSDEMGQLVEKFNEMVEHQFELIEQIVKEQEISREKEVETIQLKFELLQSQINPHFIHNTLNAISYLINKNMNDEADDMLKAFNVLLRSSMSQHRDTITLREEIDYVKSYALIQKVRYNDVFTMEYHIDEMLTNIMIPKLTIQPLVENAIYHGIVPTGVKGHVSISVMKYDNGEIFICVEDDGIGMESVDKEMDKQSFNGISFENINRRLQIIYGEDTKLSIESVTGKGTKVSFIIRKEGVIYG